jgi:hypothetical protein
MDAIQELPPALNRIFRGTSTAELPQPLLDGLGTTCYHESGIWRIFGLPGATAPVAQWIEHAPSKRVAVGSSPAGRATVHNLSPI